QFFGVTYYQPDTGWAPQLWTQWNESAVRRDLRLMKRMGANSVRVFLSFGSFYDKPGQLNPRGMACFERMLTIASEEGLYLQPTGPDHWEGLPDWVAQDRWGDEQVVEQLADFWRLFVARYKNNPTLLAYELLNEPAIPWDSP